MRSDRPPPAQEIGYALDESTIAFAEAASASVEVIGTAVEAFAALQDYTGAPQAALDRLAVDIRQAIDMMVQMAAQFDAEGVAAAAVFAESVGKVIEPIGSAVDAFSGLKEYQGVMPGVMELLFADMQRAVNLMLMISSNADQEGVKAAAAFSESVSTVFDALSAGIGVLSDLREYESIPQERMGALLADFNAAIGLAQQLAAGAKGIEGQGSTWRTSLERFASDIRAGMDALASLNGLAVNVSASVSASAGGGGGEGGGEGGGSVDGSHAMGLNRVPFDGYVAELHKDERVLTADQADAQDAMTRTAMTFVNIGGGDTRSAPVASSPVTNPTPSVSLAADGGGGREIHIHVYKDMDVLETAYKIKEIMDRLED